MGTSSSKPKKNKGFYGNIKSKYVLQRIFSNLEKNKLLKIIKNNKKIQEKLDLGLEDYIDYYSEIIITVELIRLFLSMKILNSLIYQKKKSHIFIYTLIMMIKKR